MMLLEATVPEFDMPVRVDPNEVVVMVLLLIGLCCFVLAGERL